MSLAATLTAVGWDRFFCLCALATGTKRVMTNARSSATLF